jgi:hypothetical protein
MTDLYKRLGVTPDAPGDAIATALARPGLEPAVREAAEFVLLDPVRRAVYDRNHRLLSTVGQLRLHLGLNLAPFWARGSFGDFTYGTAAQRLDPVVGQVDTIFTPHDAADEFRVRRRRWYRRPLVGGIVGFGLVTLAAVAAVVRYALRGP